MTMSKNDCPPVYPELVDKQLSCKDRLAQLRQKEWSIGNGQCPVCGGVNEAWHGHPLYTDPGKIGHRTKCHLAADIKQLGETPLYIGIYKSKKEFETYWKIFIDLQDFNQPSHVSESAYSC